MRSVAFLLLVISTIKCVASFHTNAFVAKRRASASRTVQFDLYATATEIETKTAPTLLFSSDMILEVDPVPKISPDKVVEFFKIGENRNTAVSGGGKNPVETIEMTPELMAQWKKLAKENGGEEPESTDVFLSVTTGGINFPGLKLKSQALIGSKLVLESTYPEFQFTLLGSENTAEGLPPVVWIYNKLTGAGQEGGESSQETSSFTRVVVMPNGNDKELIIKADCSLSVGVNFPKILMKILPVSKEKAEEQGSEAISKTIQKDLTASMELFREKFIAFASQ